MEPEPPEPHGEDSFRNLARSQELLLRWIDAERRRARTQTWVLTVLCVLSLGFLGWALASLLSLSSGAGEARESGIASAADRSELLYLRQRLEELSGALLDATGGAEDPAFQKETAAVEETEWVGPSLSGEPAPLDSGRSSLAFEERLQEALQRGDRIALQAREAWGGDPETLTRPPSPAPEELPVRIEPEPDLEEVGPEVRQALNQLLEDAGLHWYRFVSGMLPRTGIGLREVVLAETPRGDDPGGTIEAEGMHLVLDPVEQTAQLLLEGAHALRSGRRIEYPERRVVLDIPGLLPREWVPEPLPDLFGLDGPQALRPEVPRLTDLYNGALQRCEGTALRVREVGRRAEGRLHDVVFELATDDHGRVVRELRAVEAWWELDEDSSHVTLVCEGGEFLVDGVPRPLFRGRYRQGIRNVDTETWRTLPCVLRLSAPADQDP